MASTLRADYEKRFSTLEELALALEDEVLAALQGLPHLDRVVFRAKSTESFVAKAEHKDNEPPYERPLSEIEDQVAGRVIVFFVSDITAVRERLEGTFTAVESAFRRPLRDAEFGYESHHLVYAIPPHVLPSAWKELREPPSTFELQVRTVFMHAYSEPQHDLQYKAASDLAPEDRRRLAWIAASAWGADQEFERISRSRD